MNQIRTMQIQLEHVPPHLMNAPQVSIVQVALIVQQTSIAQQGHAVQQVANVLQAATVQLARNVRPIPAARQAKSV